MATKRVRRVLPVATADSAAEIDQEFFAADTLTVARRLVGAVLRVGRRRARIVETEAYTTDAASHAVTRRRQAAAMRETFGQVYVYLIYGVHHCLNFTTERDGVGAVLIRAAEPLTGIAQMVAARGDVSTSVLARGPGNLCRALGIDLSHNCEAIGQRIHVEWGAEPATIATSPRVGIQHARELPWRFFLPGNPCVSRRLG